MSYSSKNANNNSIISITVYIVAIVLDIILVNLLKGSPSRFRWVWLPLISLALSGAAFGTIEFMDSDMSTIKNLLAWPSIIWGCIRGIIVVIAYFKTLSGFLAVLGGIFLCIFILSLNATPFLTIGLIMKEGGFNSSSPSPQKTYSKPTSNLTKTSSSPRQGNLASYFHHISCAPQGGIIYFWSTYPSMSSVFGSHSHYTITGTLGINKQSIKAFHLDSVRMNQDLDSVKRDVEKYAHEIIRKYRSDYPNDPTDFKIDIELELVVVD